MASFPGAKVHRASRRKLGRGQHTMVPQFAVSSVTNVGTVFTVTFQVPVVVNGLFPVKLNGGEVTVTQSQVNAQTWHVTVPGSTPGATIVITGGTPVIQSMQGGTFAGYSGTAS